MASHQSKLEAERLSIIQKSMSRGRSRSPNRSSINSRSSSQLNEDNTELKWSIINRDPLERLQKEGADNSGSEFPDDDEPSEEEHISDDDNQEKFQYDDTGNILPNYACRDEKINEISNILENSNLNDQLTVRKLEELTANEMAYVNAKKAGKPIDEEALKSLQKEKNSIIGKQKSAIPKVDQEVNSKREKLEDYSSYRKKILDQENENFKNLHEHLHQQQQQKQQDEAGEQQPPQVNLPNTSSQLLSLADDQSFMIPYTSAVEDKLDSEFASKLNETIIEGEIDSNRTQSRIIQTITRGNFFQLIDPKIKPKMFLLCMDFSPESIFALEWSLGTVLVDGSVLFIVYVIEENDANHHLKGSSANENTREQHRLNMLNKAKQQVLNLLKLTKLQIHIVVEIIHHPIPRHLILELIDNLQPTLVIVGSRGQSAIKGVLLGSLSNYLVTKLSVPVMVVREKLKKINRFKNGSSVFSNNIKPLTLSEARID